MMLADRAGQGETGTKSGLRDVGYWEVRNRFRMSEMGRARKDRFRFAAIRARRRDCGRKGSVTAGNCVAALAFVVPGDE